MPRRKDNARSIDVELALHTRVARRMTRNRIRRERRLRQRRVRFEILQRKAAA